MRSFRGWGRLAARLMPLWMSSDCGKNVAGLLWHGADDVLVEVTGDVAFEAADGFAATLALGDAAVHVVACARIPAQSAENDRVERGVGLAVASAVQPAALGLARGSLNRTGAAQCGEGCLAAQPVRVVMRRL